MRYANPSIGLTVEITARRLMAHERSGYSEWGAGGSVQFAPGGAERGFSAKLGSSVGTTASGVEGLWAMGDTRGLTGGAQAPGHVDAEAGYAMGAFGGSGVITPYGGFSCPGTGDTGRDGALGSATPLISALRVTALRTPTPPPDMEWRFGATLDGSGARASEYLSARCGSGGPARGVIFGTDSLKEVSRGKSGQSVCH